MRILVAFLIAPALFPLAYLGYMTIAGDPTADPHFVFTLVLPLSYVVAFALGVPGHLALRWVREGSLPAYLVWGLLLAVIAQFTYLDGMVANWRLWLASILGQIALGPVHALSGQASWWLYGTACGGLFWLIGRPDKLRAPLPTGVVYDELNHRTVR